MSPDAIDRRLRDAGQLYKLGVSLSRAQRIGRVKTVTSSATMRSSSASVSSKTSDG